MLQDVLDEALVHAAQNERPEAVAWLLERGADPNACPYQGCGALHLAAAFGAVESVQLLLAAGAEIDRRNDLNGDNALGWAEYVLARERPGDPGVDSGPRPAARPRLPPGRLDPKGDCPLYLAPGPTPQQPPTIAASPLQADAAPLHVFVAAS